MPDQTKNQESLFPSFYYSEPTALEKEQSEIPRFHITMPNYWSDLSAQAWNYTVMVNAADLLGKTGDEEHTKWSRFIDKAIPDGMKKAQVSDDFSTYNEDLLFDVGATALSMGIDIIPIGLAGLVSEGIGTVGGLTYKITQAGALANRIVNKLPKSIKTLQKGFKAKGVGDAVSNKVAKELYQTFSKPEALIKSGNVLGIYSGMHNSVSQRLYERDSDGNLMYGVYADDASWNKAVDTAELTDAMVGAWQAGFLFPIGGAAGKGIFGGIGSKFANKYTSGTTHRVLSKATNEAGDIIGGGYAFTIPEHGVLSDPEAFAHSMGVVGALKGIHGTATYQVKKVNKIRDAFNNKLSEKEQKKAQELTELEIEQELKQSTLYGEGGEVVKYDGVTANNNVRYRAQQADGTLGKTQWMGAEKFFNKYGINKGEGLPGVQLQKRILELASELGANTTKQRRELFYKNQKPKIEKNSDGLDVMPTQNKYNLLRTLEAEKIGRDVVKSIQAEKAASPARLPIVGRLLDFATIDIPQALQSTKLPQFVQATGKIIEIISSPEARLRNKLFTDPFAIKMWRDINALPSKIDARLGEIASKFGLHEYMKNDKINWDNITGYLEGSTGGTLFDPVSKAFRKTYDYVGTKLREKGIISEEIPIEQFYSPHYLKPEVMESLHKLQRDVGNGRLPDGNLIKAATENYKLNPAEAKVVEKVFKDWLKTADKGAKKYVNWFMKEYTKDGKVDWNLGFKELSRELNLIDSNPIYSFSKGRTTEIKWDNKRQRYDADIFITDARVNMQRYLQDAARALVENEVYGKNNSRFNKVLEQLEIEGKRSEINVLKDLESTKVYHKFWDKMWYEYGPAGKVGWAANKVIEGLNNVGSGFLVSLGMTPVLNWTQPFISYMLTQGYTPAARNFVEGFAKRKENKEFLEKAGVKSINEDSYYQLIYGEFGGAKRGFTAKLANWLSKRHLTTGFMNWSNVPIFKRLTLRGSTQAVHEGAALAGIKDIKNLMDIAETGRGFFERTLFSDKVKREMEAEMHGGTLPEGSIRIEKNKAIAREKLLEDYNIVFQPGVKLTRRQGAEGAMFFADKTQLKRNVASESYYLSHPAFRANFRLKSFAIKQTKLMHDTVARHLEYGNVQPLIRLAIAGAVGKELLQFQNMLREVASGKEQLSPDDVDSLVDGLTRVGAMGWSLDLFAAEDRNRQFLFTVTPLYYSVGSDLMLDFSTFMQEGRLLTFEEQMDAMPGRLAPYFGDPTKSFIRRFESYESEKGRLDYIMRMQRNELYNDWLRANKLQNQEDQIEAKDKIRKRIKDWDDAYGHISPMEVDGDMLVYVIKRLQREQRKEMKEEEEKKIRYRY